MPWFLYTKELMPTYKYQLYAEFKLQYEMMPESNLRIPVEFVFKKYARRLRIYNGIY